MAKNIKGITIEIDGKTTGLEKALSSVTSNATKANSELAAINRSLKFNPGNTELVAQKQQLLSKQIENTSAKLEQLKAAQADVDEQFANGKIDEAQYRAFNRELVETESQLDHYKNQLGQVQTAQDEFGRNQKRLETYFKATGTSVDDFSDVLGTRLTNAIKSGKASSSDMEKALNLIGRSSLGAEADITELKEALDKVDEGGLDKVSKDIDKIKGSSTTAKVAVGSFIGSFVSNMATKAIGMVTSSLDGAIKRVDTLENAPKVLQNLGFGAGESQQAIDNLGTGIKGLPTGLDEISNSLTAVAAASGKGVDESTDLTLALNNMALAGGKGTTGASQAMNAFTKSLGKGKLEADEFNSMMDVMPAQMNMVAQAILGSSANAQDLKAAFADGSVTIDDMSEAIVDLDENGGSGMASFSQQAKDSTKGVGTGMQNAQAAVTRGVGELIKAVGSENIASAFSTMGSFAEDGLKVVGKAIEKVKEGIQGTIDFVNENSEWLTPLALGLGVFAGALSTVSIAQGIASAATTVWATVTGLASGAMGILNGVLLANPIVLIVGLIAGLVAALTYFFTQTETGQAIVSNAWNAIKNVTSSVFDAIANITSAVWNSIKNAISSVVSAVSSTVSSVWNGIKNVTSSVFNGISSISSSVWNGIKSSISSIVNGIKSTITGVWNGIKSVTTSAFNGVKSAITNPIESAKNTVSRIVDTIKGFFTNLKLKIPTPSLPPLPHFSLKTGSKTILGKTISYPTGFNVDWYAKGGIMTKPTAFGMNGNSIMAGGEAGKEAILPLNAETLGGIGRGIAETMKQGNGQGMIVNQTINSPIAMSEREMQRQSYLNLRDLAKGMV